MTVPTVVLLAAGESSRFWPLSTHGHKSLHRVCGQAIIEHTVESLVAAGFTDIVVVQSPIARAAHFPHRTIADQLGDGARYGARIRYVDQPAAIGQGDAIQRAAGLVGAELCLVQPESVNAGEILQELLEVPGNVMAVREQRETWLFGVCAVAGNRVTDIIEKPPVGKEPSNLCNMAVAKLDHEYLEALRQLPEGPIASVLALQRLARAGQLRYVRAEHPFFPLKYPWHLFAIADHLKPAGRAYLDPTATIDPTAVVEDDCVIESDAVIGPNVRLSGTLVGAGSHVDSPAADSIFGADVTVGRDVTLRSRAQSATVSVEIKGSPVDTGRASFGTAIGQGTVLRDGSDVSAGVFIGAETEITAGSVITANVPDRSPSVEPVRRK